MSDSGTVPLDGFGTILHSPAPPDDAGAQTLDRYEWQAMMATIDLLALYLHAIDSQCEPSSVTDCLGLRVPRGLGARPLERGATRLRKAQGTEVWRVQDRL